MSVWLTPDLRPIVGGTYFPPDDRYYNQRGFKSILKIISEQVCFYLEILYSSGNIFLHIMGFCAFLWCRGIGMNLCAFVLQYKKNKLVVQRPQSL